LQECNKTLVLTNVDVDYNGTKVGDYATFTCDEGYTRIGDENATCMPSQDWTDYNVSCIPIGKWFQCLVVCSSVFLATEAGRIF